MAWHPTHPSTLAVGSKGGDILLWNFAVKDKPTFIKGVSILKMFVAGPKEIWTLSRKEMMGVQNNWAFSNM